MMWSDPSVADVVPADLQDKTARFSFGTLQLRSFLQRIGCNTLIRGHEKINEGFQATVRDSHSRLFTLFSAGGKTNNDLPANSSYRSVTPMALTLLLEGVNQGLRVRCRWWRGDRRWSNRGDTRQCLAIHG